METPFHLEQLVRLRLEHFAHWNPRPLGDHLSNVLFVDDLVQAVFSLPRAALFFEFLFEGEPFGARFRGLFVIARAPRGFFALL